MDLGIEGKKALITGGGRGIGKSIAINLGREGVKVAVVSRTMEDLEKVMEELGGVEKGHYFVVSDLTLEGEPEKVFREIRENFGYPDILINNLGGTMDIRDPFCSISDWRKVWRTNIEVAIELNNLAIPYMKEKKWGRIINISSTTGRENVGPVTYCTVKSALTAYSKSLGRVLAKENIVMSAVLPGVILTEGGYWEKVLKENPEHAKEYLDKNCPLEAFGEPDDIGTMVTMLCSQQAKFCQGGLFPVDGGQSKYFF